MNNAPEPRFARIAAMIGDPTRSRMLAALLDGAMRTAGDIARATDVTPQTASVHLAKLLDAGLVQVRAQGRHRYFRLADGDVAHALEALAMVADRDAAPGRRVWSQAAMQPLRHARTCYGHLAGHLGVRLHDALIARDAVAFRDGRYRLADGHARVFDGLGFDAARVAPAARGVAYPCVDWSERRDHFAGPLAVSLLTHFVDRGWLTRIDGSRALRPGPRSNPLFDEMLAHRA
jgi:DNA-binding transcriptional ArsR family regulator